MAAEIAAFLFTYLLHSTLLLGGAGLVVWLLKPKHAEIRELIWKGALVGAIVTSAGSTILPLPFAGKSIVLESVGARSETPIDTEAAPVIADVAVPAGEFSRVADAADLAPLVETEREAGGAISVPARTAVLVWSVLSAVGLVWIGWQIVRLRRIVRRAEPYLDDSDEGGIEMLVSPDVSGPIAVGFFRWRIILPTELAAQMNQEMIAAVRAHELAHLRRGDGWWALFTQVICVLFFLQPLNFVARRQIRIEAEYLADRHARDTLPNGDCLARCLVTMGEWLSPDRRTDTPLAVGMASFRSLLGRRVEMLLGQSARPRASLVRGWALLLGAVLIATTLVAPRAQARSEASPTENPNTPVMNNKIKGALTSLLAAGLLAAPTNSTAADTLPDGMSGFLGLLEGRLVSKADDKRSFTVAVTSVNRTFKNNRATRPASAVGKTLRIRIAATNSKAREHLTKSLDELRVGELIEFGARPTERGDLAVVELLAGASPERRQAAIKGLKAALLGAVVSRDPEQGTLVIKVDKVNRVFRGSKAKAPYRIVGQTMTIRRIAGRFVDLLISLKAGEKVEIAAFHTAGNDLVFPGELFRRHVEEKPEREGADRRRAEAGRESSSKTIQAVPEGMRGVSGLISARLISKDNERGDIVMKVEKVHRLWRGNKAKNARSGEGKVLRLTGVTGKALDQLLVINRGDRFSIEIKHVSGPNLRYLGEGLKRLNEGELPAEAPGGEADPRRFMHGFRGIFIGTLVEKDAEKGSLSVRIESIKKTWKQNQAKQAGRAKGQVWNVRGISGKWLDVLVEAKPGDRLEVEAFHHRGNVLDFPGEWLKKAE